MNPARIVAALSLFGVSLAHGATVTITDNSCASLLVSGGNPAWTVKCVPPANLPPSPPPASNDYSACTKYGAVVKQDLLFNGSTYSREGPGFPAGAVYVGRFVVPATLAPKRPTGTVSVAEFGGAPTNRIVAVGTSPCDFTKKAEGSSVSVNYPLTPGTVYYVSVWNWSTDTNRASCNSACDIITTVSK